MARRLIGLATGHALEAVDAIVVHVNGMGLSSQPTIEAHIRKPLSIALRDELRFASAPEHACLELAELFVTTARQLSIKIAFDSRDLLATGLIAPAAIINGYFAERIAEQTGTTLITQFACRDQAAGGFGSPLSPAADFLMLHSESEDRLIIHLGSVSSVLFLPAKGRITDLQAFEAGPGSQFLDELVRLGTRHRESHDPGGTKAVQGHCHEAMLRDWLSLPFLHRKASRLQPTDFDSTFITSLFELAQRSQFSLNDLLCMANHLIARSIKLRCQLLLAETIPSCAVYVSGGGVRNGFLWQVLQQQFEWQTLRRTDEIGLPALGRKAASAAILASLLLDGVSGNLPLLTGAQGGRLIGRIIPGDARNWARVSAWMAEQMWHYTQVSRAA